MFCLAVVNFISLRHITIMSCHVTSCHVMPCHFHTMSRHVTSRHVMTCDAMPCHVMSCHIMSCHVMWCRAVPCPVIKLRHVIVFLLLFSGRRTHSPRGRLHNPWHHASSWSAAVLLWLWSSGPFHWYLPWTSGNFQRIFLLQLLLLRKKSSGPYDGFESHLDRQAAREITVFVWESQDNSFSWKLNSEWIAKLRCRVI